jgi:phage-related minor tail protein
MAKTLAIVLLGVDKLGKAFKSAGTGLDKLETRLERFQGAATAVGIGAGAALLGGLNETLNRDAGKGLLTAQLGLTAKEADRVGKVAGDLFASGFGDSMESVNDAVKSVVQNMDGMKGASASALKDTAGRALNVAKIMGEDVSKVTASVSTLMKTGLTPNAKEAFDVILRGTQLGANKQQDLLDTLTEYPTLFRNMGLDAKAATGLLVQGLQAGARDSDKVADAIKEFSIRAVDGSKLTAQGFQMIGLDAGKMGAAIGKGGASASKALDLTLTKLRGIEDPVLRSQAAVALFGTQAEDLGAALFALDPSSAGKKLDGFKGSVDRAGQAMSQTASGNIEAFKRQVIDAFVTTLGTHVVPKIQAFIALMKNLGISPTTFLILGGALAALALSVKLVSVATAVWRGLAIAAGAASKVWAAGVWLVNAAMRANPIGIVITIIMALVAAVVVAYQKSETFRNVVQIAWRGIQMAVSHAWNNIIKPAFSALVSFYQTVLAPAVTWFWKNIIQPAWKGITFAVEVAWGILKIIFAAIDAVLRRVVAPVVTWLWKNVIQPAWKGISFAINVAWGILKIIFAAIDTMIRRVVAPVILWLWKTIIAPAWTAIKTVISTVWNSGIKPVFENVKKGVELVGKAFESAKNFIGRVWDKIRDLAMKPVRFIVQTVYTKGIKGVWDKVAKFVGAQPLPAAPAFAAGGPVRQGTTSTADDVLIRASRNEFVVNAASTRRNMGLIDYVNRNGKNKDVLKEMSLAGDPGGVVPGFADGGIVGWVKGWASKAKNFFEDGLAKALDGVMGPINGLIDRTLGTTGIGGMVGGVPKKYMKDMRSWLMSRKDKLEGGGPGAQGAVHAARKQIGVPYSWGGGGLHGPTRGIQQGANITGFDCSSLMRYGWYQSTKKVMPRTTYTQWPWLDKVGTPRPGDLGFPHAGHVFMASGKNKIIEAPYTGARVREVPMRGAKWGRPPASFSRADNGQTVLEPGMNGVYNGTGAREPLVDPRMAGGTTIKELHVHVPMGADEVQVGRTVLKAIQAAVRRDGKAGVKAILP